MFHLSTLPSLREGGRWLVLIYVPRYVPAIVAATDFGYIWEHMLSSLQGRKDMLLLCCRK